MRRAGNARHRARRTAAQWQELVERFERAGQSRSKFCTAHGLALSTFDLWRRRLYGDADEVVFHYARSRAHRHVHAFLGEYCGTRLSDGYEGYAAYAGQRSAEVTHALCWSHTQTNL